MQLEERSARLALEVDALRNALRDAREERDYVVLNLLVLSAVALALAVAVVILALLLVL